MPKSLKPIQVNAFQGAGRRYFSRIAAEKSFFKAAVKRRCECEAGGWDMPGITCEYHSDRDQYHRLLRRFLGIYFRHAHRA